MHVLLVAALLACGTAGPTVAVDCPPDSLPDLAEQEDGTVVHQCLDPADTPVPVGPFEVHHPDGTVLAEGQRDDDGQATGTWLTRHPGGTLASRGRYVDGRRDGTWTTWHPEGTVHEEGPYLRGERQGLWSEGHPSGRLAARGQYHRGQKTEVWTRHADAPGEPVTSRIAWRQGMRLGTVAAVDEALPHLAALDGCFPSQAWAEAEAGGRTGPDRPRLTVECWRPEGSTLTGHRADDRRGPRRVLERWPLKPGPQGYTRRIHGAMDREDGPDGPVLRFDGAPVSLRLAEATAERLVFEGPPDQWPARVVYRLGDPLLEVHRTGVWDGQPREERLAFRRDLDLDRLRRMVSHTFEDVQRRLDAMAPPP